MAQCPSCQNELVDDFGLVDCPQCGAALFVEFNGSVRLRDAAVMAEAAALDDSEAEPESLLDPLLAEDPAFNVAAVGESSFEDVLPSDAPPLEMDPPPAPGEMMVELAAYGNSEASLARDGAYFYNLVVSGIDSAEVRESVKEALTDPLFLWDVEALMRGTQLGQLTLNQITPVKAALVVQRLSGLPLHLTWTQHALIE